MTVGQYTNCGGFAGHLSRRLIHVVLIIGVPWLYYDWFVLLFSPFSFIPVTVVLSVVAAIVLFDFIRVANGWVLFSQRPHEATHFSSFAWASLAVGILLLSPPGKVLTMPVVACCALVDPLMGELRMRKTHPLIVIIVSTVAAMTIWGIAARLLHFPVWFLWIMGPVTVASEWPSLEWIDDNATMILIPFGIVLLLYHL